MIDDYADLPGWIRPGAKLAALSARAATLLTVRRFTRTQIVCESASGTEYRFYRTPEMRGNWRTPAEKTPEWCAVGDRFITLVKRDHPYVVEDRIRAVMQRASRDVEASIKARTSGWASKEEKARPIEERAFDFFDEVENIVRAARRKVEQLNDPGGMLAAEHAQNLTDTTEEQS